MKYKRADLVVFRRNKKDIPSGIMSWILRRVDPLHDEWIKKNDFEPWHVAPIASVDTFCITTLDADKGGSHFTQRDMEYVKNNCKVYRWIDRVDISRWVKTVNKYEGFPYDIGAYFGTVMFWLIRKWTGKSYRVQDQQFHCWELTCQVYDDYGKELIEDYEYPIISEVLRKLEGREVR